MIYQLVIDHSISVNDILIWYDNYLLENKQLYETITEHHKKVSECDWEQLISNESSLNTYQQAASAMGHKTWVVESNQWMVDYCIRFFCHGGAARHYMKAHQPIDGPVSDGYWKELHSSLTSALCHIDCKIKLVDVGSCYNPLSKLSSSRLFDITALDLCPGHESVYRCDFLDLTVLPSSTLDASSLPMISDPSAASPKVLTSLVGGSYDVVTMSLVLSYLPYPLARETMIYKAKQLLKPPGYHPEHPHHTGLLIIIEKQSIFHSTERRQRARATSSSLHLHATIDAWKQTIGYMGFILVAYQALPTSDGRKSHAFVFANTSQAVQMPDQVSGLSNAYRLWIKQDTLTASSSAGASSNKSMVGMPSTVTSAKASKLV
jgi:hypothetical protein